MSGTYAGVSFSKFCDLDPLRLTHFKTSHTSLITEGITIAGLVDPAELISLDASTPVNALKCVYGIVELIAEARGLPENQIPGFLHQWLGPSW